MRLDNYLTEKGYFDSRTKAKQAIERGEIFINEKPVIKASLEVFGDEKIERIFKTEYVSLGGFKLEKALSDFSFSVENMVVADVGASTGGFTDCLLKHGAKKVFSIDLRNDLLHHKLIEDDRVVSIIKNAKDLCRSDFTDKLDLLVADLSFISLTQVIDVFYQLVDDNVSLILLIKPQFETGKRQRFKNGIIRDKKIHKIICKNIYHQAVEKRLYPQKITTAPIHEEKNVEFLILLTKNGEFKSEEEVLAFLD